MNYIVKDHKKLRCGYTTGTCATAAAKAATHMLITKQEITHITVTPLKGNPLTLLVEHIVRTNDSVTCSIKKDAGDDADCTDGIDIYATVSFYEDGILIDGGIGIGRVTSPGLQQPVGAAAINSTPRAMITKAVEQELMKHHLSCGLNVLIFAPSGVELAQKTFNPRLGIVGGISILGTTGIVEPMSEQALLDTIKIEIHQKSVQNYPVLLLSPGNYGQDFTKKTWNLNLDQGVKCSNFIGETLDFAVDEGFHKLLLIGHIGKLVKLVLGIMNTHSKMADGRLEALSICALLAGSSANTAKQLLSCTTTDDALVYLKDAGILSKTMKIMMDRILTHLQYRLKGQATIEVIVFSNVFGILSVSNQAEQFIAELTDYSNQNTEETT